MAPLVASHLAKALSHRPWARDHVHVDDHIEARAKRGGAPEPAACLHLKDCAPRNRRDAVRLLSLPECERAVETRLLATFVCLFQ